MSEPILPKNIMVIIKKALAALVAGVFLFNEIAMAADFQNLAPWASTASVEFQGKYVSVYDRFNDASFERYVASRIAGRVFKKAAEDVTDRDIVNLSQGEVDIRNYFDTRPDKIFLRRGGETVAEDALVVALPGFMADRRREAAADLLRRWSKYPVIWCDEEFYYEENKLADVKEKAGHKDAVTDTKPVAEPIFELSKGIININGETVDVRRYVKDRELNLRHEVPSYADIYFRLLKNRMKEFSSDPSIERHHFFTIMIPEGGIQQVDPEKHLDNSKCYIFELEQDAEMLLAPVLGNRNVYIEMYIRNREAVGYGLSVVNPGGNMAVAFNIFPPYRGKDAEFSRKKLYIDRLSVLYHFFGRPRFFWVHANQLGVEGSASRTSAPVFYLQLGFVPLDDEALLLAKKLAAQQRIAEQEVAGLARLISDSPLHRNFMVLDIDDPSSLLQVADPIKPVASPPVKIPGHVNYPVFVDSKTGKTTRADKPSSDEQVPYTHLLQITHPRKPLQQSKEGNTTAADNNAPKDDSSDGTYLHLPVVGPRFVPFRRGWKDYGPGKCSGLIRLLASTTLFAVPNKDAPGLGRWQFTLSNLLEAVFWVAISISLWRTSWDLSRAITDIVVDPGAQGNHMAYAAGVLGLMMIFIPSAISYYWREFKEDVNRGILRKVITPKFFKSLEPYERLLGIAGLNIVTIGLLMSSLAVSVFVRPIKDVETTRDVFLVASAVTMSVVWACFVWRLFRYRHPAPVKASKPEGAIKPKETVKDSTSGGYITMPVLIMKLVRLAISAAGAVVLYQYFSYLSQPILSASADRSIMGTMAASGIVTAMIAIKIFKYAGRAGIHEKLQAAIRSFSLSGLLLPGAVLSYHAFAAYNDPANAAGIANRFSWIIFTLYSAVWALNWHSLRYIFVRAGARHQDKKGRSPVIGLSSGNRLTNAPASAGPANGKGRNMRNGYVYTEVLSVMIPLVIGIGLFFVTRNIPVSLLAIAVSFAAARYAVFKHKKLHARLEEKLLESAGRYAELKREYDKLHSALKKHAQRVKEMSGLQALLNKLLYEVKSDDLSKFPATETFSNTMDSVVASLPAGLRKAGRARIEHCRKLGKECIRRKMSQKQHEEAAAHQHEERMRKRRLKQQAEQARLAEEARYREAEEAAGRVLEDARAIIAEERMGLEAAVSEDDCQALSDDLRLAMEEGTWPSELRGDGARLMAEIGKRREWLHRGALLKDLDRLIRIAKGHIPAVLYQRFDNITGLLRKGDDEGGCRAFSDTYLLLADLRAKKGLSDKQREYVDPIIERLRALGLHDTGRQSGPNIGPALLFLAVPAWIGIAKICAAWLGRVLLSDLDPLSGRRHTGPGSYLWSFLFGLRSNTLWTEPGKVPHINHYTPPGEDPILPPEASSAESASDANETSADSSAAFMGRASLTPGFEVHDPQAGSMRYEEGYEPPELTYELYVIAHGVTPNNAKRVMHGCRCDGEESELNEEGRSQAHDGAEEWWETHGEDFLKNRGRYVFRVSPLKRARQTYRIYREYIKKMSDIDIGEAEDKEDYDVRETDFGSLDGRRFDDPSAEEYLLAQQYLSNSMFIDPKDDGESIVRFKRRVYDWMMVGNDEFDGDKVFVFGHGLWKTMTSIIAHRSNVVVEDGAISWLKSYYTEERERGRAVRIAVVKGAEAEDRNRIKGRPDGQRYFMEPVDEPRPESGIAPGTTGPQVRPQPHEPSPYRRDAQVESMAVTPGEVAERGTGTNSASLDTSARNLYRLIVPLSAQRGIRAEEIPARMAIENVSMDGKAIGLVPEGHVCIGALNDDEEWGAVRLLTCIAIMGHGTKASGEHIYILSHFLTMNINNMVDGQIKHIADLLSEEGLSKLEISMNSPPRYRELCAKFIAEIADNLKGVEIIHYPSKDVYRPSTVTETRCKIDKSGITYSYDNEPSIFSPWDIVVPASIIETGTSEPSAANDGVETDATLKIAETDASVIDTYLGSPWLRYNMPIYGGDDTDGVVPSKTCDTLGRATLILGDKGIDLSHPSDSDMYDKLMEYERNATAADYKGAIASPLEFLIHVREHRKAADGEPILNKLLSEAGYVPAAEERRFCDKLADTGVLVKGGNNYKFADIMKGAGAEYTRDMINIATDVMAESEGKSNDFVREVIRAKIVDYNYRKLKARAAPQAESYSIRIWQGYAANRQKNLMRKVADKTEGRIQFAEIESLIEFASKPENINSAAVTILPRGELSRKQRDSLAEVVRAGARIIYIDGSAGEDGLADLEGLIALGTAYLNGDQEAFYRLYRLLAENPMEVMVALDMLRAAPDMFIDTLKFTLRPIKPIDTGDLRRINSRLRELLLSA